MAAGENSKNGNKEDESFRLVNVCNPMGEQGNDPPPTVNLSAVPEEKETSKMDLCSGCMLSLYYMGMMGMSSMVVIEAPEVKEKMSASIAIHMIIVILSVLLFGTCVGKFITKTSKKKKNFARVFFGLSILQILFFIAYAIALSVEMHKMGIMSDHEEITNTSAPNVTYGDVSDS